MKDLVEITTNENEDGLLDVGKSIYVLIEGTHYSMAVEQGAWASTSCTLCASVSSFECDPDPVLWGPETDDGEFHQ